MPTPALILFVLVVVVLLPMVWRYEGAGVDWAGHA
jgi:hypothetical protein